MRFKNLVFLMTVAFYSAHYSTEVFAAPVAPQTPLDTTLAPQTDDEVSNVFRDMGVVQKKAMAKSGRFLLSTFGTLDFSDGPYTNYAININPGYAVNDFFEVYANITPFYIVSARSIVKKVSDLQLSNGLQATITAAKPKYQYGIDLLWAPLYGKDSLGVSRVIRSDTFIKLGVSQIKYDTDTGMGFKLGVGKTFFLTKFSGFRFCVDYGYIQTVVDSVKTFKSMLLTEFGMTFYL